MTTLIILLLCGWISMAASDPNTELISSILPFAQKQHETLAMQQIPLLRQLPEDPRAYPFSGLPTNDTWRSTSRQWTSGFMAGAFWHLSALTSGAAAVTWKERAQIAQEALFTMQTWNRSHDIGFIIFPSFGNAYIRTENSSYLAPLRNAAVTLSVRFNKKVGCTRSWDNPLQGSPDRFVVIIDNMMNLELLFWVANRTANSTLYDMAVSHANRTSYEHVRPDGSTCQVVAFNATDGAVLDQYTVQGYANDSTWARGQAWAIYGFTMAYRYTRNPRFIETARKTADYFLEHLPAEDMVPYWDFDSPYERDYEPRDTSAAAIAASGLVELGRYAGGGYGDAGIGIVKSLMAKYRGDGKPQYRIPAILVNATSNYNKQDFDRALIFGEYYFLDALLRISGYT